MSEAGYDHNTPAAPPQKLLIPSRRQRQELIRKNRRLVDEAREAQRRPGSNVPPVTPTDVEAHSDRIRARITATLERAQIIHPDARPMVRDIVAAFRAYIRYPNVVEAALRQISALVSDAERLVVRGTTLQELDVLAPTRILCNALRDALAREPATLHALLPARDESPLAPDTRAHIRAAASAGLAVLTLGKAQLGGISQTKATEEVRDAFAREGIDFTASTVGQWFKDINRNNDPAGRALYEAMIGPVRQAAETYWPIKARRAALKRLADEAGRKLET